MMLIPQFRMCWCERFDSCVFKFYRYGTDGEFDFGLISSVEDFKSRFLNHKEQKVSLHRSHFGCFLEKLEKILSEETFGCGYSTYQVADRIHV